MKHGWDGAHCFLSQCDVRHCERCVQTRENVTCEGVLFTHPVGCSRLPSAVNDLATIFLQKDIIMSSTIFYPNSNMKSRKKTNATLGIDEKELVQVALLKIRGGDGS